MYPATGLEKPTISSYAHRVDDDDDDDDDDEGIKYETEFVIPADFGPIGAIYVKNEHHKEMYLKDIVIDGIPTGTVRFACKSWINSKSQSDCRRIFFTTKSYLPSETPSGLKRFREEELKALRGHGKGTREAHERIYDYDVYDDLGNPDKDSDLKRPVLGGKEHPYPRRCRTGRARSTTDPLSEAWSSKVYVPRDEAFSGIKQATFQAKTLNSLLHGLIPALETIFTDPEARFPHFPAIDDLFDNGVALPPSTGDWNLASLLPRVIETIVDRADQILRFRPPESMDSKNYKTYRLINSHVALF